MGNEISERKTTKEIAIFETEGVKLEVTISPEQDTVWLSRIQMAELFDRDIKTIGKHIANARREELKGQVVVAKFATTTQHGAIQGKTQTHMTEYYNLDVIISVGYRVKSNRGVEFRKWANKILKEFILKGYVVNDSRLKQLNEVVKLMKRTEEKLDTSQVLSVIERYAEALQLLDNYDHQTLKRPEGNAATYVLDYDECRKIIDAMGLGISSTLFGKEKDDFLSKAASETFISVSTVRNFILLWRKKRRIFYIL